MPIVQCPSCHDDVTAPENPPVDAIVRCPLCHDEFALAKVMDSMPPALILLSGGGDRPLEVGPAEGISGAQAAASSFDFSEKTAPSAKSKPGTTPRRSSRPKRKQANPLWEVFKVVGGGVIGLSIGQLILWWAFHRDPVPLAPKVPAVMQWILPAALRTTMPAAEEGAPSNGGNVGSFPLGRNEDPFLSDGGPVPQLSDSDGTPDGAANDDLNPKPPQPVRNGTARSGNAKAKQNASQPREAPPIVRVSNSPVFGPGELETAIKEAEASFSAWRDASQAGEDTNSAAREFYIQFAKLGHTIAYADPSAPENRRLAEEATALVKKLPENGRLMFGAASASWLRNKRSNEGVALYGDVTRIEPNGKLFETILRLTDRGGRRVTIISGVDPSSRFQSGDRILVLGGIVEDPAERIEGYDGLAPMVVLGGLPIKFVAKTNPKPPQPAPTTPAADKSGAAKSPPQEAKKQDTSSDDAESPAAKPTNSKPTVPKASAAQPSKTPAENADKTGESESNAKTEPAKKEAPPAKKETEPAKKDDAA